MKTSICKIFITLVICFIAITTQGQKPYTVKISLAGDEIDLKHLDIEFSKRHQFSLVPGKMTKQIIETNNSYLRYPTVEIIYSSLKHRPTVHRFFLTKQTTEVEIDYDSLSDDIKVKTKSPVLRFEDAGQHKFELYAKHELLKLEEFWAYYKWDLGAADSTVMSQLETYDNAVRDKHVEFVKKNPTLLYSTWLFMNEIIGDRRFSKEYLVSIYNTYFKPTLKNTYEETYILAKLDTNRLGIHTNAPFQNMVFKDLSGNSNNVQSFKGKPLIIMIWATWCVPCVAELPKLKELHTKFKKQLQIISFSTDTDETTLRNFVADKNMDWINVYDRRDLANIYGSDLGIPQVYLLDKNGVIIYSRTKMEDYDLSKLESFIEKVSTEK